MRTGWNPSVGGSSHVYLYFLTHLVRGLSTARWFADRAVRLCTALCKFGGENESFFFASGISNLLDLFIHLGAVLIIWRVFLPKIFEVTCPRNLRPV